MRLRQIPQLPEGTVMLISLPEKVIPKGTGTKSQSPEGSQVWANQEHNFENRSIIPGAQRPQT